MQSSRRQAFLKDIAHIDCKDCGSEFLARLVEDHEIRHHWPKHNKAQKHPTKKFGVLEYPDQKGYLRWGIQQLRKGQSSIISFQSAAEGREWLHQCSKQYRINPNLFGLPEMLEQLMDTPAEHASKLQKIKSDLAQRKAKTIIKLQGRSKDELAMVYAENEQVLGYSFFDFNELGSVQPVALWEDIQETLSSSPTSNAILRKHLSTISDIDFLHIDEEALSNL